MDSRALKGLIRQCLVQYVDDPQPSVRIEESATTLQILIVYETHAQLQDADTQGLNEQIRQTVVPLMRENLGKELGRRTVRVLFTSALD